MKHRARLTITAIIALFGLLALVSIVAGRRVRLEIGKSRTAAHIGEAVADLQILTSEYVMRPEVRTRTQWQGRYAAVQELLSSALFSRVDELAVLRRIEDAYVGMGNNFNKLVALHQGADGTPEAGDAPRLDQALQQRLVGQILVLNHAMTSGAADLAEQAQSRIEDTQRNAERTALGFVVVASVLALVIGQTSMNRTVRRVTRVTEVATRVAAGDLTVELSGSTRRDEIGTLMQAFRTMVQSLREQAAAVREASTIIGTSASDISSSIAQVTSGATETAAALSETTATVEELKQTADLNSRKAKEVSDAADHAAHTSQEGISAAEKVAAEITHLRRQMGGIADNVMRLSEQSQDIGDIIEAVEDLTEQSNLLAVNAAIEAAKAGEHGKGFAVVADEIKNLSEQSKESTRRVRAILVEIQKGTRASVMATEQGNHAVETVVKEASDAGHAITELAKNVEGAAASSTQIAVSSHQQMVGVDQVAAAMGDIKQAAEQNVDGMRQIEAASRSLQELSKKLVGLMEHYQV
jgi:methyl-accepting chemotaxis protein